MLVYPDDHGSTWKHRELSHYALIGGYYAPVLLMFALLDCLLLTHDNTYYGTQGIYRIIRRKKDTIPWIPTHLDRHTVQLDPQGPLYIPFARAGVTYDKNRSFVIAACNGFIFFFIQKDTYQSLFSKHDPYMDSEPLKINLTLISVMADMLIGKVLIRRYCRNPVIK